jgi:hypothetical protein
MAHALVRCGCDPICPGISDRSLAGWLWRLDRCARQDPSRYKMVLLQVHFNARESEAPCRLDRVRALAGLTSGDTRREAWGLILADVTVGDYSD